MLVNIRYKEVKVRRPNSHLFDGDGKFTGSVMYSVIGTFDRQRVRLSLGTGEKAAAIRRIAKLEKACLEGAKSSLWSELADSLPVSTFEFFADRVGYVGSSQSKPVMKATWGDLCGAFEIEMQRLIENKQRGATKKEGVMSDSTRERYRQTIRHFTTFLQDSGMPLENIDAVIIARFKTERHKKITVMKQGRGGSSIALDVAVLHRMFAYGMSQNLTTTKPINLAKESKPGENPKNGARPFTGEELKKIRVAAGKDMFTFLLLRWTGLRCSDAMKLRWEDIRFGQGINGELQTLTEKRCKIAIVPLAPELRNALEEQHIERKPRPEDRVLLNPGTGKPFLSRKRLYERMKEMGVRAGVQRVTPHCFRDTFACDMLARENDVYVVAKMLADTVDTVEKHYAQFVPAARNAVQVKMDSGIGIEEQAEMNRTRGRKVVAFPAAAR